MKKYFLLLIILSILIIYFTNKNTINLNTEKIIESQNSIEPNAFSGKLIEGNLFFEPVETEKDIERFNNLIFMGVNEDLLKKIDISILDEKEILYDEKLPITKIDFELLGKKYWSFAYGKKNKSQKALLIIPGSGSNQSSKIYMNDKDNYHYGLKHSFEKNFDVYVFIKPNEDYLAMHNTYNKINYDYIYNWHINKGGSYSFSYIVQSIAFSKYLKKNYDQIVVAGLSQGGEAAFINSLYSDPDFSIISSGLSVYHKNLEFAGRDQIIIPNKFIYNEKILRDNFSDLKTNFFFSWGVNDTSEEYKREMKSNKTCNFFKRIINLTCFYGESHEFPVNAIEAHLK